MLDFASLSPTYITYDKSLLPAGMTEEEIKTYSDDEELGHWQLLERVTLDTQKQEVTSYTDPFTDMINSVVTAPEAPDTVSYNPNQLKDIKAADPGTGVSLIEPPQANHMGSAGLSYPLEVPPGRVGMQPQVAVQYNSSGGNGWMGLG